MSFSKESKRAIRERDGNQSVRDPSGLWPDTECSHYDHDRTSDYYDDPANGHVVTRAEHLAEHLVEVDKDFPYNKQSVELIWNRMTPDEQAYFRALENME